MKFNPRKPKIEFDIPDDDPEVEQDWEENWEDEWLALDALDEIDSLTDDYEWYHET